MLESQTQNRALDGAAGEGGIRREKQAGSFVLSYYPARLVLGHKSLWLWAGIHAMVSDFHFFPCRRVTTFTAPR
jgi:hypothetical protein